MTPSAPAARRRDRRTGVDATATWVLARVRRPRPATADQAAAVARAIAAGGPSINGTFRYRQTSVRVRPVVERMLVRLWAARGGPVPVADLCEAVYGRPASLRAIRQTAFRCSRVFERAGCPFVVCCHGLTVFVHFRVRRFTRCGVEPTSSNHANDPHHL